MCPDDISPRASVRLFGWSSTWVVLLAACLASPVYAGPPRVQFDLPCMVACRDVTNDEFELAHPGDRLLQAEFDLSTMLAAGDERDLLQFIYRFVSPHRSLRIHDYAPQTTLASQYVGNIGIEKKQERTKSAGLAVTGSWQQLLKATGSGDIGAKDSSAVRYELAPPLQPLTASGTIRRGHGVYFKLRPSAQASFEGAKPFTLVLRAPSTWRGDYLQVRCEARGVRRGVVRPLDEPINCGARDFFVALYLEADHESKAAAQRLVESERRLQNALVLHRENLISSSRKNVIQSLAALFESREDTVQASLSRLIYSTEPWPQGTASELPPAVRVAVRDYLDARSAVCRLNGQQPAERYESASTTRSPTSVVE